MKKVDYYLLGVVGVLLILGILVLAGVSASFSQEKFGSASQFLFHQLIVGLLPGLILAFIAFKLKLGFFKKYSGHLILIAIGFMLAVFIPGLGIIQSGDDSYDLYRFAVAHR